MPTMHLSDFDEDERADYMVTVASLVAGHGQVTSQDIFTMRELCIRYVLGPRARGRVMAACSSPPHDLDDILGHLGRTPLKYSLILDLGTMGLIADGKLHSDDRAAVDHIADAMEVNKNQVEALLRLARVVSPAVKDDGDTVAAAIENAVKTGVPEGAIGLCATLYGLSVDSGTPAHEAYAAMRAR